MAWLAGLVAGSWSISFCTESRQIIAGFARSAAVPAASSRGVPAPCSLGSRPGWECWFRRSLQSEAEKLLRALIDKPTAFVSKEEATIVLAQLLLRSKPQEARKLLEPLRNSRTTISVKAIATLGLIPQTQSN